MIVIETKAHTRCQFEMENTSGGKDGDNRSPFYSTNAVITSPGPLDIFCGRGRSWAKNSGNLTFMREVRNLAPIYEKACRRVDRVMLVSSLIKKLKRQGARFIKKSEQGDFFYEIDDDKAHDKAGHAIRDHITRMKQQASESPSKGINKRKTKAAATKKLPKMRRSASLPLRTASPPHGQIQIPKPTRAAQMRHRMMFKPLKFKKGKDREESDTKLVDIQIDEHAENETNAVISREIESYHRSWSDSSLDKLRLEWQGKPLDESFLPSSHVSTPTLDDIKFQLRCRLQTNTRNITIETIFILHTNHCQLTLGKPFTMDLALKKTISFNSSALLLPKIFHRTQTTKNTLRQMKLSNLFLW